MIESNDNQEENCASSVIEYLQILEGKIIKVEDIKDLSKVSGQYIFRGVTNSDYEIISSARIAINGHKKANDYIPKSVYTSYHERMIKGFKDKGFHRRDGRELSPFEILAEIQHSEVGQTLLTDFTKNTLVALYFAVFHPEGKHTNKNGRVYLTNYKDINRFKELTYKDAYLICKEKEEDKISAVDKVMKYVFDEFDEKPEKKGDTLSQPRPITIRFWEVGLINQRIPAQHSIFLLDRLNFPKDYFKHIDISKSAKPRIIKELKLIFDTHGLSLFNDIPGYAKYYIYEEETLDQQIEVIKGLIQSSDYEEAIRKATSYIRDNQDSAKLYFHRAYAKGKNDDYNGAIADFTKVIELEPDNVKAYFNRADTKRNTGDHDGAIADFTKAIDLEPDNTTAYIKRSRAKNKKTDYLGAIADLTEAIKLDPYNFEAYGSRAHSKGSKGDHDGAIADYTTAIVLKPYHAIAYINRAYAKSNKGDFDGAIADCTKAIKLKPDNDSAYISRANIKRNMGDYNGAITDYTKAIKLNPDNNRAYINRANIKRNMGDYEESIADLTKAIGLFPGYAKAYNNRGIAKGKMGDYEGAIADYTKAIELQPDYAHNYINRGIAYCLIGDKDNADKDIKIARELAEKKNDTQAISEIEKVEKFIRDTGWL